MADEPLDIKVNTKVDGLKDLATAVQEFKALIESINKTDKSFKDMVSSGEKAAKALEDIKKAASTKTFIPEYTKLTDQFNLFGEKIRNLNKEIEIQKKLINAIRTDATGKAVDPDQQKTLNSLTNTYRRLTGEVKTYRSAQNAVSREMHELKGESGKEHIVPIDYNALSQQAKSATSAVKQATTDINNQINKISQEEKDASKNAELFEKTSTGAYASFGNSLRSVVATTDTLKNKTGSVFDAITNSGERLSKGTQLIGSDFEQLAKNIETVPSKVNDAARTVSELETELAKMKDSGTLPTDVWEYFNNLIQDAKFNLDLSQKYIDKFGEKQGAINPVLEQFAKLKDMAKQIESIDIGKALAFGDTETINKYNSLIAQYSELRESYGSLINLSTGSIGEIKQISDSWLGVEQAMVAVQGAVAKLRGSDTISPEMIETFNHLRETLIGLKQRSAQYTAEAKKAKGVHTQNAKAIQQHKAQMKSLSDSVKETKQNFEKISKAMGNFTSAIKSKLGSGLKTLMKYVLGFRSLFFLVRKIRTMIKEGLDNLVQFESATNETNHQITNLQSSLLYLKNALAAAFAPIINVVVPILNMLIDKLAETANAIGMFFARLTGQATVLQAVKVDVQDYADSLKKAGSAAGGAAKKTKDLHDRLAPFDDLQVLGVDKDKDTSGSGGGSGGDLDVTPKIEDMFKRVQSESNLADMLKKAWVDNDFSEIGRLAGEKIKEGIDAINWDTIQETISKGIHGITTFANSFLQTPGLFSSAGASLAEGINTITGALEQFFTEFDFFNNAKSVGESITAFFETLDFGQIARSISSILISIPELISGFFAGVNWKSVGKNLYNGIKSFLQNFDLAGINKSLGKLTGYLLKAIGELAWGLGEELFKDIKEYFETNDIYDVLTDVFSVLTGDAMLSWVIDNVAFPIAQGILEAFGVSSEKVEEATSGVKDALLNFIHPCLLVVDKIKEIFQALPGWFNSHIIQPIVNFFKPIVNTISTIFKTLVSIIYGIWLSVSEWFNEHVVQPIVDFFAPIVKTISDFFSSLWSDIKYVWDSVASWFSEHVIEPVIEFFRSIWDSVSTFFSDLWEDIKEVWKDVSDWFKEYVIDPLIKVFDGIAEAIKGSFNVVLAVVESAINAMIKGFNKLIDKVNEFGEKGAAALNIEYTAIPTFKEISIPRLATGAVIPPNREFLAMLGDQKSGTNIEAPLDTIVEAFRDVLGSMQVETGNQVLQVDGQTFARLMTPYVVSELGRRGYNVKILEA